MNLLCDSECKYLRDVNKSCIDLIVCCLSAFYRSGQIPELPEEPPNLQVLQGFYLYFNVSLLLLVLIFIHYAGVMYLKKKKIATYCTLGMTVLMTTEMNMLSWI